MYGRTCVHTWFVCVILTHCRMVERHALHATFPDWWFRTSSTDGADGPIRWVDGAQKTNSFPTLYSPSTLLGVVFSSFQGWKTIHSPKLGMSTLPENLGVSNNWFWTIGDSSCLYLIPGITNGIYPCKALMFDRKSQALDAKTSGGLWLELDPRLTTSNQSIVIPLLANSITFNH